MQSTVHRHAPHPRTNGRHDGPAVVELPPLPGPMAAPQVPPGLPEVIRAHRAAVARCVALDARPDEPGRDLFWREHAKATALGDAAADLLEANGLHGVAVDGLLAVCPEWPDCADSGDVCRVHTIDPAKVAGLAPPEPARPAGRPHFAIAPAPAPPEPDARAFAVRLARAAVADYEAARARRDEGGALPRDEDYWAMAATNALIGRENELLRAILGLVGVAPPWAEHAPERHHLPACGLRVGQTVYLAIPDPDVAPERIGQVSRTGEGMRLLVVEERRIFNLDDEPEDDDLDDAEAGR